MCREMENMCRETAHEKAVEIAKKMLLSGKLTTEDIADFSGLTVEEVKALSEQKTAQRIPLDRDIAYPSDICLH